jgi:hypothetical protein
MGVAMAKGTAVTETRLDVETPVEEQPMKGGSYIRNEDGSLKRDQANSTSEAEPKVATYPNEKVEGA